MKFTNSWKSTTKQVDKLDVNLRVGFITFLGIYLDLSDKKIKLTLLNFSLSNYE